MTRILASIALRLISGTLTARIENELMSRWILSSAIVALAMSAAFGIIYLPEHFTTPDLEKMRSHRLSGLENERLRELYRQAAIEVERLRTLSEEEKLESRKKLTAELQECNSNMADAAYKARHPNGCNGLPLNVVRRTPGVSGENR
jgi:cell shape-determining protein MreC